MTWPTAATKANLDSAGDDPSQARAELAALVDKVNALITDAVPPIVGLFVTNGTSNPSTVEGSGFTVVRSGVGSFAVTFTASFASRARVVCSTGTAGLRWATPYNATTSGVTIIIADSTGSAIDLSGLVVTFFAK